MKVLIVEEEEILYLVLEENFINAGHTVMIASDGEQAQEKAEEFIPDVIILDIVLPKKSGFDVLKAFKQDKKLKLIPVIILYDVGIDIIIKDTRLLGVADYFCKTKYPISGIVEITEDIFSGLSKAN